jgi:hypothetical protein
MRARSGRPGFLGVSPVKSLVRQFEPACLDQGRNGLWRGSLHVQPVFSPFHNMARIVPSWSLDEGIVRRFVRYRTNISNRVRAKVRITRCLDQELRFAYGVRRRARFFEICEHSFARAAQLAAWRGTRVSDQLFWRGKF